MDYLEKLQSIGKDERDSWNDDIEEFLGRAELPPQRSSSEEIEDALFDSSLDRTANAIKQELERSFEEYKNTAPDQSIGLSIRTGKNLLRWYIQIYLEHRRGKRQRQSFHDRGTIDVLRSPDTLSIVLEIMIWAGKVKREPKLAREASLYIFYGTFSHFPGDETASKGIIHLLTNLSFPQRCLEILATTDNVPLALSLVRNLHSMSISIPGAQPKILEASVQQDLFSEANVAPWVPPKFATLGIEVLCLNIMKWSLNITPPFPGVCLEDRRAELVNEILHLNYAMRKGRDLVSSRGITSDSNPDVSLVELVSHVLKLKNCSQDNIVSKRTNECKLSTISLLIDADTSFGKWLVEHGLFHTLLDIFQNQVNDVVGNMKVDSTAAASLLPILVVLNRFCMADSDVQRMVKEFVFPKDSEEKFIEHVKQKKKTAMTPVDAPKDSLRGKLVILLSWVDGHVKRFAAELMWTLCNSDYTEFTCRVGLGNALSLLNSKGLSPIPLPS